MKKLSNSEKVLVIVLSIFILGFIYQKYFLAPILVEIQSVNQEITITQDKITNIKIAETENKKQAIKLKDINIKFKEAIISLPQSERNPEIPYGIKIIADSNKVIVNNITLGKGIEYTSGTGTKQAIVENKTNAANSNTALNAKLMACPVTLSVSSDYISLIKFMAALEQDKRLAEINSVNISEKDKITIILTGSITLSYYYIGGSIEDPVNYEFNKGTYGKVDLFR